MAFIEAVVDPHVWTLDEAFKSGKAAYRIKVELSGNPFTGAGNLGLTWEKGWKDAASKDTTSPKRVDYNRERFQDGPRNTSPRHNNFRNSEGFRNYRD